MHRVCSLCEPVGSQMPPEACYIPVKEVFLKELNNSEQHVKGTFSHSQLSKSQCKVSAVQCYIQISNDPKKKSVDLL